MDIQQSAIILNYLADKYTDGQKPEKKRVKFSTIRYKDSEMNKIVMNRYIKFSVW